MPSSSRKRTWSLTVSSSGRGAKPNARTLLPMGKSARASSDLIAAPVYSGRLPVSFAASIKKGAPTFATHSGSVGGTRRPVIWAITARISLISSG